MLNVKLGFGGSLSQTIDSKYLIPGIQKLILKKKNPPEYFQK